MVPFAGWNMPVQYAGITHEHQAVRTGCGIFDISHMGEFFVSGPGAGRWLNSILTNNTEKLQAGQGHYTLMLNEQGGVIDDLIAYRTGEDSWFLVVNASMIPADREWMSARLPEGVNFKDDSAAWAGMAVQGPNAPSVFETVLPGEALPVRNGVAEFSTAHGRVIVCRTGYTGEDGFELFTEASHGVTWWDLVTAAGATPCGLGARDTLRLEACYPLNGNDLSPARTPLEAGLVVFVDLEKGDFTGRRALVAQKADGLPSRLCALRMVDKSPPPRAHYPVRSGGETAGELSSGGVSPTLGSGIALSYLPPALAATGTRVDIDIRGKLWPAEVVKKPFYRRPSA